LIVAYLYLIAQQSYMSDSRHRPLIDRYIAAYNAFDIDGMLALLSSDVRFENYSEDQLTASASGIEEFRQVAEQSKSLFSEREQRVTALEFNHDAATATISYRGRLAADIPEGPRAGTPLSFKVNQRFHSVTGRSPKLLSVAESTPSNSFKPLRTQAFGASK
jgi:SnoaL-like domain